MAEISETPLPGVGVRHEFTTAAGERVGVLSHRTGRRELLVYDREDPDSCRAVVDLDPDDAHTLTELLGASQVSETLASLQLVEGLAIDWLNVAEGAELAGIPFGDAAIRTRTGVTIVAVLRGKETIPAPGPQFALQPGDVAITVGRPEGIQALARLLAA